MGSNMNVTMVWAWMLRSSYGVEHVCYYGLGMGALVFVWGRTCMLLWFGHGCSGHRMGSNMNVTMVWAWMLRSSYGVEYDCYYGLGMDALVMGSAHGVLSNIVLECS